MERAEPPENFANWRNLARGLLQREVPPAEVLWAEPEQDELFGDGPTASASSPAGPPPPPAAGRKPHAPPRSPGAPSRPIPISAAFLDLARVASCHADPGRWALLYSLLWRLTHGQRRLLELASDEQVARAQRMARAVRREIHKAHAFVRFRKVGERADPAQPGRTREQFVAWFEPEHFIVEAAAPFFVRRFPNQDWSILTPKGCAHWDGEALAFRPGVPANPGHGDALEEHWRTYYRSIFNPARLKLAMMKSEMAVRYWKNLPEAGLIPELTKTSFSRTEAMTATEPRPARPVPALPYLAGLRALDEQPDQGRLQHELAQAEPVEFQRLLRRALDACRACPLWENATCGVAGEGPLDGRLVLVGEQPGDAEDLAGRPFIGPAGRLLERALAEAGIDRSQAYLTNAVKHFKWQPGPRQHRLHQSPNASEIEACHPWLELELRRLSPRLIVLLGGGAARSLLGPGQSVTRLRGWVEAPGLAPKVFVTVHPSSLLRLREHREGAFADYVSDFREVRARMMD